jgi:glycoprotein endo-alpha-1,2-mannosidase
MANRRQNSILIVALILALIGTALGATTCNQTEPVGDWVYVPSPTPVRPDETVWQPDPTATLPSLPPPITVVPPTPTITPTPASIEPPGENLILAHYMVWFRNPDFSGYWHHWNWDPNNDGGLDEHDHLPDRMLPDGRPDLATPFQPLIAPYDSLNPATIEYQLASAWAAGIDGFVVDWYGPNDPEDIDLALRQVFDIVERWRAAYSFRFFLAVTYEEKLLFPVVAGPLRVETAIEHFDYVLNTYTTRPGYLHYNNIPLVFYFEAWPDGVPGLLRPAQLEQVFAALPEFYLLYMGAETEFLDTMDGFYSWVGGTNDDPADWGSDYANWVYGEMDYRTKEHNLVINVGSVWPGFDDSKVWGWNNVPRYVDRQDGEVYSKTWEYALSDEQNRQQESPSWVQIVTWNDWNEGSQVEPAEEYGRRYLEATQQYAARYTGRQLPPEALLIPEAIYLARQNNPGSETETVISEAYQFFFARQFDTAWQILQNAGFTDEVIP